MPKGPFGVVPRPFVREETVMTFIMGGRTQRRDKLENLVVDTVESNSNLEVLKSSVTTDEGRDIVDVTIEGGMGESESLRIKHSTLSNIRDGLENRLTASDLRTGGVFEVVIG